MAREIPKLQTDYFDLAYCKYVLYQIGSTPEALLSPIRQMKRVVKPGGFIIAVEPKVGAKYKEVSNKLVDDISISRPIRVSAPVDISDVFESLGLVRMRMTDTPQWAYCYRKEQDEG